MHLHLFGAHQQHGDIDGMAHLVGSRAVQNVANKAVPVCRHGNQIDLFLAGELDDFIRRLAQRQNRVAGKTFVRLVRAAVFPNTPGLPSFPGSRQVGVD